MLYCNRGSISIAYLVEDRLALRLEVRDDDLDLSDVLDGPFKLLFEVVQDVRHDTLINTWVEQKRKIRNFLS